MFRAQPTKYSVELCFEEAAEAMLVEDDVVGFRGELHENVRVPGVAYQDAAFAAARCLHDRSDAHALMPDIVGAVNATYVREVRLEGHLQVDHRNAAEPRRRKHSSSGRDSTLDHRDIDTGPVEHTALRAEVVLHVDNENGTGCYINRYGGWLGMDRCNPAPDLCDRVFRFHCELLNAGKCGA